jgi:hypothetical protein
MCNFSGNNRRSRAAIIIIIVLDDASKNITHARSWDACPRSRHKKMDHGSGVREHKAYRKAASYNIINLQFNSATPETGKPTKLLF